MKGIVLLSGGLDSTLVLLTLLKEGHKVTPMFVDYNQWPLDQELAASIKVINWASSIGFPVDTTKSTSLSTPIFSKPGYYLSSLVCLKIRGDDQKVGSVWGRGIALVGLAAMWAYTHGNDYKYIALGNHSGDVGPDCKPGLFDINLNNTLIEATKCEMELVLPIRHLTTEDIGKGLAEFGIPWNLMYSCYWTPHCQYKSTKDEYLCPGCRRKFLAMREGGATEEELLLPPNAFSAEEARTYQSDKAERPGY